MPTTAHFNRQLFSNHFLEVRLRADESWESIASEADDLRSRLRELYRAQRAALEEANEPQTEERWVRPVLAALGWGYEVQPVSRRHGTVQFPDYALFPSQAEADRAASEGERRRILKRAATVLEAKRWERDLDAGDPDEAAHLNRVPSTQIINYLIRAEQPWGILTNGREWRLYHRDADFADTTYFAVDLPALLDEEPLAIGEKGDTIPAAEAFRYFHLFFRPHAFRVEVEGKRWLDLAREASARYARAVEAALKPRAYRAVEALCRGFVNAEGEDPRELVGDPERAGVLLDNTLTLLFRLLFLLYAESRDLLPVRTNAAYRHKSLLQLRERAAEARDRGDPLFPRGRDYWNDLHDLFRIVDGDPAWRAVGIPVYDGGLFDPDEHPWLERRYPSDPDLAEAIDLLSRSPDPDTGRMHYVDYGPLDVRNLGSIYEGLLEHRLRIDDAGELILANEKGERKTTGSYYTPHYVVEYIVDRTLWPLVEGRTPEEVLRLRVLDPAMGSGHFLVSATAYLARAAVSAVEEEQGQLGELARLDPERLRRLVVERCIFGVDKNPRAVELAKLSLWIATVQRGKPLNFLDHHLKCGDSLLGARVRGLGRLPARGGREAALEAAGQVNAFESALRAELTGILDSIIAIEATASDTLGDVKRKEALYQRADLLVDRYRVVADLWCSALLGNEVDGDAYARAVESLHGYPGQWEEVAREEWMVRAARFAGEHRFFHWELEFGEVFYEEDGGRKENPGFDAVIGNPPYVRMEAFKGIKEFLRALYGSHDTRSDLYVYFVERSLDLLREGGEYGMIVSNKFLRANYGRKLRALIGREAAVREIVDFGGLPVFPEATVRAAIVRLTRGGDRDRAPTYARIPGLAFDDLAEEVAAHAFELEPSAVEGEEWLIVPRPVAALLEKLESAGEPLGDRVKGRICYGIKTGLNDAFIIDDETRERLVGEDPRSAEVIKPLVVGSEIRRYRLERGRLWLLYLPHGTDISRYPAIERHLAPFRDRLEKRATKQAWYELQQPQQAYVPYFEEPKIIFPDMATDTRFAMDNDGLYSSNTTYFIPEQSYSLLSLLNSSLGRFYFVLVCAELEGRDDSYLRFFGQYLGGFPVRRAEETTSPDARRELGAWLRSLYFRGLRLDGIEPDVPDDIRELGERIGALEGVERVVLIGSWARGEAREDSDVDLVVIGSPDGSRAERGLAIRRHVGEYARGIDIHVYSPQEARRESASKASFLGHVLSEGVVLYDGE